MSLADQLTAALEREIVLGEIKPGLHLDEGSLAARFGMSRTPVREALGRLSVSGLVELRPRRGAVVAGVSEEVMAQRFEAQAGLEGLCAYYAAIRMTDEERHALHDAHRRCRKPDGPDDYNRYFASDMIFHRLILEGCRNDILVEQTLAVRRMLRPWRRLQLYTPGRVDASIAEHAAIVSAMLDADAARAELLTRAHVNRQSQAADQMVAAAAESQSQSMP